MILWIPLVLAFWTTVGLRASVFVPSELPASWSFHANAPVPTTAYWSGVRASMLALVVPPALGLTVPLIVPLLGWRVAAWHALVVCALLVVLVETVALTIDFIPFTRPYRPGHANLRSRWPIYALGLLGCAYLPVQVELRLLDRPVALVAMVACLGTVVVVLEVVGRYRARRWSVLPDERDREEWPTVAVLNLVGAG